MRTHVALLRGVNVSGRNKVPMAALRDLVADLGCGEVETYIQSGNVVFSAGALGADEVRMAIEAAIAREFGVTSEVVVVSASELVQVMTANPFPGEADDRKVHVVFRTSRYGPADREAAAEAERRARSKGGSDEVSVTGGAMYLWTPDGFGRSELAVQIARLVRPPGTARNWATVKRLAELVGA